MFSGIRNLRNFTVFLIFFRMLLSKPQNDLSTDAAVLPYVLHKLDKDGTLLNGPPGLEVRLLWKSTFSQKLVVLFCFLD